MIVILKKRRKDTVDRKRRNSGFEACTQDCNGVWGGPDNQADTGDEALIDVCGECGKGTITQNTIH